MALTLWATPGCLASFVCGPNDSHSLVFRDEGLFDELSAGEGPRGPYEVSFRGEARFRYQLDAVEQVLDHRNYSWVRLMWGPLPDWPVREPIMVEAARRSAVEFVFEDHGEMEPAAFKPLARELLRNITNANETAIDDWADQIAEARITNSTIRAIILPLRPDLERFIAELDRRAPVERSDNESVGRARVESGHYTFDFSVPVLSANAIQVDELDLVAFTWIEERNRVPVDEMESHLADAYAELSIGEPPAVEKRYITGHGGC